MKKWKIASIAGIAAGAIVLVCALAGLLFSDSIADRFIKPRILEALAEAYPGTAIRIGEMHYSPMTNRFGFDSVALSGIDTTFSGTIGSFSASGISWLHLLRGGRLDLNDFAGASVEARDVVLTLPQSRYQLRCGRLWISVADSEMVVDSLTIAPSGDDESLFAGSTFRQTRYRVAIPSASVVGCAFLDLLNRTSYRARFVHIQNPFVGIVINKEKPFRTEESPPRMPGEILSSIEETLRVDSVRISNALLMYGERFAVGARPALITVDNLEALATGIANHGDSAAALVVHAEGRFMKTGAMYLHMSMPIAATNFSYTYSGAMGGMDASALNPFLETAEQMRLKTGVLQGATFEIDVASGRASGSVRAIYTDLSLAAINKETGSEKGFADGIASFFANNFKLRTTNVPDGSGSLEVGEVNYTRKGDEFFMEFTWFALRSGLGDVVGF